MVDEGDRRLVDGQGIIDPGQCVLAEDSEFDLVSARHEVIALKGRRGAEHSVESVRPPLITVDRTADAVTGELDRFAGECRIRNDGIDHRSGDRAAVEGAPKLVAVQPEGEG